MSARNSIHASARTAAILFVFAVLGTAILAFTYDQTKSVIERSKEEAKLALIGQTLPSSLYDNNLIESAVKLPADPFLGTRQPSHAYIAKKDGRPVGVVLEAIAPDGYSGAIHLLIAIRADGEVTGVRVVSHTETPGLGDYIEVSKSRWIHVFDGTSLQPGGDNAWKVKKDGGQFDFVSGATITPRAIVKSVHNALQYFHGHQKQLLALPSETQTKAPTP